MLKVLQKQDKKKVLPSETRGLAITFDRLKSTSSF